MQQGQRAIAGADLLVFLVDGREGLVSGDETIAAGAPRRPGCRSCSRSTRPTTSAGRPASSEFYQLGIRAGRRDFRRARHRRRRSARRDRRTGLQASGFKPDDRRRARQRRGRRAEPSPQSRDRQTQPAARADAVIAIVGRPNVGKSSLLNRLLKEERVLVSDMPGTTRDAIDATLTWHRRQFRIVDTAGMRRPGRVRGGGKVELVSVAGAKKRSSTPTSSRC